MADNSGSHGSQKNGSRPDGPDYVAMEPEFIANVLSLRALGEKYGCSDTAIRKHFKKLDVKRDPKKKIKDRAAELVRRAEVLAVNARSKATDKQQVDAAAQNQADLILKHRKNIAEKRALVEKLYGEIEALTDGQADIEEIMKALSKSKDEKWKEKLLDKVTSLPGRIKGTTDLMKAFESLIKLERQAFGITGDEDPEDKIPTSGTWTFEAVAVKKAG